jgi:hypothetical protein
MRRLLLALCAATALVFVATAAAAKPLCVGGPGCYATVQAALDAASDGDTIKINPGTHAGGVSVTKSVALAGAGANVTTIRGGGPVVTIGEFLGTKHLDVTVSGVTITGGVATSSPLSDEWVGRAGVIALGGGISIQPSADFSTGATVTLRDSVVTGNRAAPTDTAPFGPPCPSGPCPFAWARGGGIDNWGRLTLVNATVSGNSAAGLASDATGGGVNVWRPGSLTVQDSRLTGNLAFASVPNGRFAEGGGIFTEGGVALKISGSAVNGNEARLESELPFFVDDETTIDMNANGGGVHAGDGSSIDIRDSQLNGNTARVDDLNGEAFAFDAALHPGEENATLTIANSTIDGNHVIANVGSTEHVGPSGSALDMIGAAMISNTRITNNTTLVFSPSGLAQASGGAVFAGSASPKRITNSTITGNRTEARSGTAASVMGAAILLDGDLELRTTQVKNNTGAVTAPHGFAQGGGIWKGDFISDWTATGPLSLWNTTVTGNSLTASSAAVTLSGGGIFSAFPVSLNNSIVSGNTPDQCVGC